MRAALDPLQWQFRKELVHDDEVYECYRYEITRDVPAMREAVAHYRRAESKATRQSFDRMLAKYPRYDGDPRHSMMAIAVSDIFIYCPEWPDRPYLAVPRAERKRRLAKVLVTDDAITEVSRPFHGREDSQGYSTVAFEIDWSRSPSELADSFYRWAKASAPESCEQMRKPGAGSDIRQFRTMLTYLSAVRLAEYFGSPSAARGYDECEHLPAQFKHASAWTKAANAIAKARGEFHF